MTSIQTEFNFETARSDFKEKLSRDLVESNAEQVPLFNDLYNKYTGTETEKKTAADQTLRDLVKDELNKIDKCQMNTITDNILNIVSISISVAKQGLSSPSIPFIILGDVFDCITLDACDSVFHYVEERVGIWKSTTFYSAGKNYLLRMCNDLLRRLSQSKNTVFCGRIQLFLARLFPLSEKSALNLVSQFNLENVTIYNKDVGSSTLKVTASDVEGSEESMQVDNEAIESDKSDSLPSGIVDHQLYQNIWALQDLFRYPVQCYTKELWNKFTENADAVFRVFSSFKLEDVLRSRASTHSNHQTTANRVYFSKFLTSEKLTDLQLNDAQFRRQILTQFLILFRYLTATVKFKGASLVLTDSMKSWMSETEPKIYKLLKETPPNGDRFAQFIKHLMEREEYWIAWKNEGCPSFMKTAKVSPDDEQSPTSKKRKLDDNLNSIADEFISGKNLGMGSPELTRLWSLSPDNLAACQNKSREFIPSIHDFFMECIEQNDPKNMIEDQYKSINKSNFQWKALRLLSHRSQLFFTSQPTTMQFKTVPDYLSTAMTKLAKDIQILPEQNGVKSEKEENQIESAKASPDNESEDVEGDDVLDDGEDNEEEMADEDDSNLLNESADEDQDAAQNNNPDKISSDDVTAYATKISGDWKKLAPHLDLKPNTIKEIEEDSDDVVLQARQTLVTWQDMAGKQATATALTRALKSAGLEDVVNE